VTYASASLWVLYGIFCASVLVWLGLSHALYKRLSSNHPDKYRQMGEPGLIRNNRPGMGIGLMKFIFRREDRPLNDPRVSRLTAFMFVLAICNYVLFAFFVIIVLLAVFLVGPGVRGS